MSEEELANLIVIICITILDAMIIMISLRIGWLKQRKMEIFFPEWKNTKKSVAWFIIWSFCILLNVAIISLVCLFESNKMQAIIAIISLLYYFPLGIIYIIVKYNISYIYDKRSERLEKEKEAKEKSDKIENDK